jgi:ABC-type multidrug transport system fused ATPase/permease subunit
LVAVDIKKLELPFSYFFQMYATPFQFLIAGVQLYNLLGNAALVGVAFMIASYPIPAKLYAMIMKLFKDIMNTKDERMDALNEMLGAIRIVKFFGWEAQFVKKITAAREKELKRTKDSYVQIVFADIVWMLTPLLNTVVILLAYTKLFGHSITASKIFTTLALFNIMRQALNSLPWNIKSTMQAIVSLNRINKFLSDEEVVLDTTVTKLDPKARLSTATLPSHPPAGLTGSQNQNYPIIGFVNASFIWPNKEHDVEAKDVKKKPSWIQRIKSKFSRKSATTNEEPIVAEVPAVKERFKLKNITVDFPVGQLSLVVGPTGSGKSALLLALLGELEKLEGHMYLPRLDYPTAGQPAIRSRRHHRSIGSGIAYVSQTAWLQNTTIRDNILFGKEFKQDRYDAVIEGCALLTDFEILESGDKTEIGEQGITLSGGQKQRVSLARAIYSDAEVLLLDDCLSAVDSHTGKHLFQTLTGPLLEGRTVVMATHQVQLTLGAASTVVVLNKGEILGVGTPEEAVLKEWVENVTLTFSAQASDASSEISTLNEGDTKTDKKDDADSKNKKEKISVKLTEEEKKQEGAVAWKVYKTYLNASGGWLFWTGLIGIFFLREIVDVGQNAWLAVWANKMAKNTGAFVIKTFYMVTPAPLTQAFYSAFAPRDGSEYGLMTMTVFGRGTPETVSVDYYLGIYVLLSICAMILGSLNLYYVVIGGLEASRVLHERLLKSITRAKVRFFDTTPMGRIVNRFSSDISTIDDEVSNGIQGLFGCVTTLTGIIVIISINMPIFLVAAFFIVIIYGVIGALYVPISRDLKRLNSNSKSPILNHFNESLNGLATIRAYGFQKRFLSKNLTNLDDNNRTFFLLWSTNRWLHWRVDVVGASVAFITGILVLQNWGLIEPGWAALSLTYSLMFTGNVVWFIRMYAMNEMNLNSVERVVEYMDLESEPAPIIEGSRPPASWPHAGEIKIEHLTMRYAPDTPEVIKDITLTIHPGEKVGVVGRTGSGKSTLAISLFRFMDPAGGTITIDGIDICKIGLQDLRSNLTIIPQDPILFKGTLRSNLDPFGEREDRELWEALRRSHLIPAESKSIVASAAASKRNSIEFSLNQADDLLSVPSEAGPSTGGSKSPSPSIKPASSDSANPNGIIDSSKITLDTPVKENGSNFSQGQRQLIALARALVRQSKIIVMDEATASVDFETDLKIQLTIREEMADATIVTIAHRIRTIADFDRVLVMNAGEVVEFDRPYRLMRQEDSLFRSMCERSSEFEALLAIAEEKENRDRSAGRLVDV